MNLLTEILAGIVNYERYFGLMYIFDSIAGTLFQLDKIVKSVCVPMEGFRGMKLRHSFKT